MANHKPDLYRWKRQTEPSYASAKPKKPANVDDIQRWIQKVEEVTNQAAAETFGVPRSSNKRNAKYQVLGTVEQVRDHEDTYEEAQELLQQWMSEKVDIDDEMNDYLDPEWEATEEVASPSVIKNDLFTWETQSSKKQKNVDVYAYDYEKHDEGDIVNNILQNLMDKEVVQKDKLDDLRRMDTEKDDNPKLRMEMRHQRVKENREKREKELERKRLEKQRTKEAHLRAKQIIMKEDRDKQLKEKQEEMMIQKEMARIRREMKDHKEETEKQRKKDNDILKEDRRIEGLLTQRSEPPVRINSPRMAWEPKTDRSEPVEMKLSFDVAAATKRQQQQDMKHRRLMKAMEVVQTKEAAQRLQILQRHFSAWYDIVLEKRVTMGKAQAIQDWKCLLRAWNAWKAYTRSRRLQREDIEHQVQVKYMYRLNHMAEDHVRLKLLRHYFQAWRAWVQQQQTHKEIMEETSKTRNKMSDLLQAAASGQLWTSRSVDDRQPNTGRSGTASAREKVEELFAQPSKKRPQSASRSGTPQRSKQLTKPTEPWQVTKRHVRLTKEQIAHSSSDAAGGGGDNQPDAFAEAISEETGQKKPWEKAPFAPNNFEHRQKAQQKILMDQQKRIREQQRMIEDLIYNQQQEALKQQAGQQQLLQKHLDNMPLSAFPEPNSSQTKQKNEKPNSGGQSSARTGASTARSEVTTARSNASEQSSASKSSKLPSFLKGMEERAAERTRMKAEREAKKRKEEEEKLAQIQAEEEERAQKEAEAKKAKMEEYREKKRREREKEEERLRGVQRLQELAEQAGEQYHKSLVVNYGWRPWRRLVEEMRINQERATEHAQTCLLRKVLLSWYSTTREVVEEKEQLADEMYNFILVKRYLGNWKKIGELRSIQEQKADKFYASRLRVKVFNAWLDYITQSKFDAWENERRARKHDIVRMVKKYFVEWRKYPAMLKAERAREQRLANMRKKVASMLPDFNS